jgi:hypothetical protein
VGGTTFARHPFHACRLRVCACRGVATVEAGRKAAIHSCHGECGAERRRAFHWISRLSGILSNGVPASWWLARSSAWSARPAGLSDRHATARWVVSQRLGADRQSGRGHAVVSPIRRKGFGRSATEPRTRRGAGGNRDQPKWNGVDRTGGQQGSGGGGSSYSVIARILAVINTMRYDSHPP